jgi:hypothetical protein
MAGCVGETKKLPSGPVGPVGPVAPILVVTVCQAIPFHFQERSPAVKISFTSGESGKSIAAI